MIAANYIDTYQIGETKRIRSILVNKNLGELIFAGRSFPEDAASFYLDVLSQIDDYFSDPKELTIIKFK